jgi:hypothetical protein
MPTALVRNSGSGEDEEGLRLRAHARSTHHEREAAEGLLDLAAGGPRA